MKRRYRKERSHTPAWLDTLIVWFEFIGLIGTVLGGAYALVSWLAG
jgi:hypothetical protein